jgi:hypothetical protein
MTSAGGVMARDARHPRLSAACVPGKRSWPVVLNRFSSSVYDRVIHAKNGTGLASTSCCFQS